jgi:arylsulfate sulfotransferase
MVFVCVLSLWIDGCDGGSGGSMAVTPPSQGAVPGPQQMGVITISPQRVALAGNQSQRFTAGSALRTSLVWSVNGVEGGNASVGTIDSSGNYLAPTIARSMNVVVRSALVSAPQDNFATAVVALFQPGQVQGTANPQVAAYSMVLPQAGTVVVQFGTDARYGLRTWSQSTPATSGVGGPVTIEVAGMRGTTTYHLQALVSLPNGVTYADADRVFTTGAPLPTVPVVITTAGGSTPQPGIQLFDSVLFGSTAYNPALAQAFATDLQGNVIWTYRYSGTPANVITPIKLLPNGHFLLNLTVTPPPNGPPIPAGTLNDIREIDLAGNTIRDLSLASLNHALPAHGFSGFNLFAFSRDMLALPNGHFVFLVAMAKEMNDVVGYPGTTNVAGDVLIDVDENYEPDWVWSTFDHLDVNRHPFQFPDWTHSDALLYSADDHDLLLSVRNQNWIIKIDFKDAAGTGDVLWRLGEGGDFRLIGGVDPTDWFYAQHGMNFFGEATSGVFELGLLDDGDDRMFPPGINCGTEGAPPCLYSTVPVFQIDESSMTATIVYRYSAPASYYSFFGGQADRLANGDIEADFAATQSGAVVQEFQPGSTVVETSPQIVWQALSPGVDMYRAVRLPSLYPGVQW